MGLFRIPLDSLKYELLLSSLFQLQIEIGHSTFVTAINFLPKRVTKLRGLRTPYEINKTLDVDVAAGNVIEFVIEDDRGLDLFCSQSVYYSDVIVYGRSSQYSSILNTCFWINILQRLPQRFINTILDEYNANCLLKKPRFSIDVVSNLFKSSTSNGLILE